MATKTTNKTIWTLVLCAIIVFLVWKLWPELKHLLSGGGGGGGAANGGGGVPYYPQNGQNPYYPQSGGGPSLGVGGGAPSAGGSPSFNGRNALSNFLAATGAIDQSGIPGSIGYYGDVSQQGYDAIDNDQIAYQPLTNDTSDLNAFENWFSNFSQPVPGSSVGPSTVDSDQLQQIQTISDTFDDDSVAEGGDVSDYNSGGYGDFSDDSGYNTDDLEADDDYDYDDSDDSGDPDNTFGYGDESTGDAGGYFDS